LTHAPRPQESYHDYYLNAFRSLLQPTAPLPAVVDCTSAERWYHTVKRPPVSAGALLALSRRIVPLFVVNLMPNGEFETVLISGVTRLQMLAERGPVAGR
jgi:hypothetical protein